MTDRLRSITELPGRLSAWALALPPVRWLQPIMDDYTEAGGGLLASGLAFNSLFAILPAILLLVSILGLLLQDPAALDEVIRALSNQFPPLAAFFEMALSVTGRHGGDSCNEGGGKQRNPGHVSPCQSGASNASRLEAPVPTRSSAGSAACSPC